MDNLDKINLDQSEKESGASKNPPPLKGNKLQFFIRHRVSIVSLGLLVILMVVFTFYDLKISDTVFDKNSTFGKIFREIGEVPVYLIIPFFFASLAFCIKNKPLQIILSAAVPFTCYFWLSEFFGVFNFSSDLTYYLVMAAVSLVFSAALLLFYSKLSVQTRKKLLKIFLVGVVFAVLSLIFTQSVKALWGRVRYVNLDGNFTRWYVINGINGNKSFPSGHTGAAAGMFVLLLFSKEFALKLPYKLMINAIAIGFIIATAVSRVILGAHYATDVTFAILMCYSLFLLSEAIVKKAQTTIKKHSFSDKKTN